MPNPGVNKDPSALDSDADDAVDDARAMRLTHESVARTTRTIRAVVGYDARRSRRVTTIFESHVVSSLTVDRPK
jgi:hypothetical protein